MTSKPPNKKGGQSAPKAGSSREEKLAQALRANLRRRKAASKPHKKD